MKREIRICALTLYPYDSAPGQRYRIEQWEPFLKEQDIKIKYFSFSDQSLSQLLPQKGKIIKKIISLGGLFVKRISLLAKLKNFDVIFIYRTAAMVGPAIIERIIKLTGKPIIYDFDDAIFLTHTHESNKLFGWTKFSRKTAVICSLSDAVTVGNNWLADYARKHNQNVTVIPSSVNTDIYQPPKKTNREKLIVGWTGSSTSQTHLEMHLPLLSEMVKRFPIELQVHSDRVPNLENVPFVWHKWSLENEIEVISNFDIGIMPLPFDEWSNGKCSMKALLYMSLGVPTICTEIGMNKEVIQNGVNGYLVKYEQDWFDAINILVNDKDLRLKIGEKARNTVIEKYSTRISAEKFAKVVKEVVGRISKI